jgi:hypothetical protein
MGELDKRKLSASQSHWRQRGMNGKINQNGYERVELDPRIIKAGFDLTAYYVEVGLRSFSAYAQKMIEEYGYDVRPYLRSWYLAVRYYPGVDPAGMDSAAKVDEIVTYEDGYN